MDTLFAHMSKFHDYELYDQVLPLVSKHTYFIHIGIQKQNNKNTGKNPPNILSN